MKSVLYYNKLFSGAEQKLKLEIESLVAILSLHAGPVIYECCMRVTDCKARAMCVGLLY